MFTDGRAPTQREVNVSKTSFMQASGFPPPERTVAYFCLAACKPQVYNDTLQKEVRTMTADTPIQPQMHKAGPPYASPIPNDAAGQAGAELCVQGSN